MPLVATALHNLDLPKDGKQVQSDQLHVLRLRPTSGICRFSVLCDGGVADAARAAAWTIVLSPWAASALEGFSIDGVDFRHHDAFSVVIADGTLTVRLGESITRGIADGAVLQFVDFWR